MNRLGIVGLVVALAFAALAGAVQRDVAAGRQSNEAFTEVSATFAEAVHARIAAEASQCENSPGPEITLSGELALGKVSVQLIFRNNVKGTHEHTEETTASAVVIPEGESVAIPKQPVLGGVGGNPFIWIQMLDGTGAAVSGEIFLGRCVQGLDEATSDFFIPATATARVTGGTCDNTRSDINLGGELSLSGIGARLIFRNNDNPVGGPHEADEAATVDVVLIPAGTEIAFPKQPVLGGVGGNPWIWVVFLNAAGEAVSDEILLGRCVQDF